MASIAEPTRDPDVLFAGPGLADVVTPRRLVTGDGSLDRLGPALAELAVPRGPVLLVADAALRALGVVATAEATLRTAGFEPVGLLEAMGEPDLEAVTRLCEEARARPYVAVVGMGGGSAMDPAKLLAALATSEGAVADYLLGARRFERPPLPLALVPTTAGTGAEASRNAIVTHEGRKLVVGSPLLVPALAVLDPLLTVSCPPGVTAASGMDAMAHAVEAVLSTWATPFTTLNALAAVRTLASWLPAAVADGSDLPARRATLSAAYLAGLSINASPSLGHSLAYTIAARTHLPHGVTTAMALPYCVAYAAPSAAPQVALVAREAGTDPVSLPLWLRDLADEVGLPRSLADVGIAAQDLPAMVEECLVSYPRPNSPRPFERAPLLALCERFLEGDVSGAVEVTA